MTSLIKKLSIALVAGVVAAVGFVAPANASTPLINPSVDTTGATAGSVNPNPITITFTTATALPNTASRQVSVLLPSDWSFVSPYSFTSWGTSHAAITSVTAGSLTPILSTTRNTAGIISTSVPELWIGFGTVSIPANTTFTIVLPAGVVNVGSATSFTLTTVSGPSTVSDQSVVSYNGGSTSSTVTFNANNGSGAMADQSGTSLTPLNVNAFTRPGFNFAGWNTVADGSGTAYADGEPYAFTSSTTLYAQWTATLANTGFDGAPYLVGGIALAVIGGGLLFFARRKNSN